MNILNLFRREKEIDYQLKEFIRCKEEKHGMGLGVNYMGWLRKFIKVSRIEDIKSATTDDCLYYKEWVVNQYPSDYMRREAMRPLNSFLRFYRRCDIIFQMNKLGRKPDFMAIAKVKQLRSKKKSYTEIIEEFKKGGRKIDRKQVFRWVIR